MLGRKYWLRYNENFFNHERKLNIIASLFFMLVLKKFSFNSHKIKMFNSLLMLIEKILYCCLNYDIIHLIIKISWEKIEDILTFKKTHSCPQLKIFSNISTNNAAFCALQRMYRPFYFYETQMSNPFFFSKISANHDKDLGF